MSEASAKGMTKVIVVGGGLAGLAAGALLSHAGAHVTVLERRPVLGGRALVVKQEGFTLNYGLHYIVGGYRSPHYRILKLIGKLDNAPMMPVKPRQLHRMRDGRLNQVPSTPLDMLSTKILSVRGKLGLAPAMLKVMTANIDQLWYVPVGEWLDGVTHEPTLRAFFLDLVGPLTFEPEPEKLSAAHFVQVMRPLLMPKGPIALYPVGGWITMFEAFRKHIEERGGSVQLKAPAERLEITGSKVSGVWVKGELQRADYVVLALPPNELNDLLKATPIAGLEPERLRAIRPTIGVAVDLGVMGLKNDHVGTIELPELNGTLGIHNLFEPSLAPAGGHLFQFLRFMTPQQMQDKAEVERTEPMILDVLERIWPGFRDKIVVRRTLVRSMLTGASHRYDQPRPTLLPVDVNTIDGLYLAGDATASAGELSNVAGESALTAAGLIAKRAGLAGVSA
jgi:15-cis-phytoene desaturase